MATVNDLRDAVLELMWSQWHELGVAATVPRRHSKDCIDPESLIAFTAVHADLDARLRDESIDWVLRYGALVSRARLKNIVERWDESKNVLFNEYAATLNAHGSSGWPSSRAKPLAFRPRARSLLEDLTAPALLSLRIRATFGVGARAELIRAFLARPESALTAADLADETSYGKRNVLNELEPLSLAGVIASFRAVNADRYSLAKFDALRLLLGPLPERFTRWTPVFAALHGFLLATTRAPKRSALANAADVLRALDQDKATLASAGIYAPSFPRGEAAWPAFIAWATSQARSAAGL